MPLLSPRPPPPNASPGVTPSLSSVSTRVSHLLTSPGSSTPPLSLPWILVSPPQSYAQNSCLALWKRAREGHTLAVQATLLVVAALTFRSSYKVSAHTHILSLYVCVVVAGSSEHGLLLASNVWWCVTSSKQLLTHVPSVSLISTQLLTVSDQKLEGLE